MDKVNVNLLRFLAHYDYLDFDSHDLKDGEQELNNTNTQLKLRAFSLDKFCHLHSLYIRLF
ncbi:MULTISPECIES: hypothetical protein [Staphylococcus]|uniref:hypothetical protein n=1 Tax=Staphylococcus TaxID=1279 RepID=UPI0012B2CE4D|nr:MULTISPECIES: hypothetical protein [Staphylococcus]MCQ9294772.1 hypothetical protein [Staphylococcus cohnii]MSU30987.1 hypothetical protein [Staphylococcus sp. McC-251-APC-3A2]